MKKISLWTNDGIEVEENYVWFVPFELNMSGSTYQQCDSLFEGASKLEILPIMNNFYPSTIQGFCKNCYRLRTIPEEVFNNWNYNRSFNSVDNSLILKHSIFNYENLP